MSPVLQRVVGGVVLLVAGVYSLPLSALLFDRVLDDVLLVLLPLVVMALLGAGLAVALPALAGEGSDPGRRALTGAWWGLLAAVVGVLVMWFAVTGLRGA